MTYCKRIGKYETNKTRPIAINFLNHGDQEFLLSFRKSLPNGIYVDKESPSEVRIARDKLWSIFKYGAQSDTYKGKCKMLYDSILIDGKKYGITDLLKLPDEINPLKHHKNDNNILVFFGLHSPFSNFHYCKFSVSGTEFTSRAIHSIPESLLVP